MGNISVSNVIEQAVGYINQVGKTDEIDILVQAAAQGNAEIASRFMLVKKGLGDLAQIVKEQAAICDAKRKAYQEKYIKLHSEGEKLQAEYDDDIAQQNEFEAQIIKLQAKINATALEITEYYSRIAKLDNEIDMANKAISKAEKTLYWSWIATPYLIYTLIDLKETKEKSANQKLRITEEIRQLVSLIDSLECSVKEMSEIMNTASFKSSELGIIINLISQQISETISQIADTAHIFSLWEGLEMILLKAVSAIENSFSQQAILNSFNLLLEMKIQIENAEQETQSIKNSVINGCVYRGNVLYQGQILRRGEYLASLNKRFVALLTKDGKFAVYNTEQLMKNIAENVEQVTFGADGLVRFAGGSTKRSGAAILIMQDDGNLVTYDQSYSPLWATDTWCYGFTATKPFYISLPSYSGSYKIASREPFCFDIRDRSFSNGARLQLYWDSNVDNQRFDFEQAAGGAYKITAVHSGKCLDICGESISDGAEVIQYDFHNGQNQLFWVLPCKEKGYVKFVAVHSSKVIDVTYGNFANFTTLQQYFENGSEAQMFKLIR